MRQMMQRRDNNANQCIAKLHVIFELHQLNSAKKKKSSEYDPK